MGRLHLLFNIGLHRRVKILNGVFFALEGEYICCTLLSLFEIQIFDCVKRAVLMGTKSCTKILNFSTRFSCENLDVEDFVTLLMGKILVDGEILCLGIISAYLYMLFYAGEIQNSNNCRRLEMATYFFLTRG